MTTTVVRQGPWARLAYCHGDRKTTMVSATDLASWHRDSHVEWDEVLMSEVLRAAWEEQFIARLHRQYQNDDVFRTEKLVGNQAIADRDMMPKEYLDIKPSYEERQRAEIKQNRWLREAAGLGKNRSDGDASLRTWSGWVDRRNPADVLGPEWAPENVYMAEVHNQATPPFESEPESEEGQDDLDDKNNDNDNRSDDQPIRKADPPVRGKGRGRQHRHSAPSDGKISVLSDQPGTVFEDSTNMELHRELVALIKEKGRDVGPLRLLPSPSEEELDPTWVKKERLKQQHTGMLETAAWLRQKPAP